MQKDDPEMTAGDVVEIVHATALSLAEMKPANPHAPPLGNCLCSKAAVASSRSKWPTKQRSRWPRLWEGHSSRCRSRPTKGQPKPGDDAWLWRSYRSRKRRRAPSLTTLDRQALAASTNLNFESAP